MNLLPCPFCGAAKAEFIRPIEPLREPLKTIVYGVRCRSCSAWGPSFVKFDVENLAPGDERTALEAWNKRAERAAR
jgi:Lar family restriction alleviation protein